LAAVLTGEGEQFARSCDYGAMLVALADLPRVVVYRGEKPGQQKVNKAARDQPIWSELIWLK
jgi:hypothetical protein